MAHRLSPRSGGVILTITRSQCGIDCAQALFSTSCRFRRDRTFLAGTRLSSEQEPFERKVPIRCQGERQRRATKAAPVNMTNRATPRSPSGHGTNPLLGNAAPGTTNKARADTRKRVTDVRDVGTASPPHLRKERPDGACGSRPSMAAACQKHGARYHNEPGDAEIHFGRRSNRHRHRRFPAPESAPKPSPRNASFTPRRRAPTRSPRRPTRDFSARSIDQGGEPETPPPRS